MKTVIRKFRKSDINKLARIHHEHLDAGILSQMGEFFLRDFYKTLFSQENVFTFVALQNGKIVGFATGAVNLGKMPKYFLLKLWPKIAFVVIKRPHLAMNLLQLPFYSSFREQKKIGEIFSIAVIPQNRGQGIGKILIEVCRNEFRKLKCKYFQVSVRKKLKGANSFYQKIGLKKIRASKFLGKEIIFWQGKC